MRVISGDLKGRNIKGFTLEGTRPTMDRVKESMFGSIQNIVPNSIFLDLFAGSGSIGIEAISNGATKAYFVDNNKLAVQTIKENIDTFNIKEQAEILKMDYNDALKYFHNNNITFDVIFIDPPYAMRIINEILDKISEYKLLNDDGVIICEIDDNYLNENIGDLSLKKSKKYGSTYLYFYKWKILLNLLIILISYVTFVI